MIFEVREKIFVKNPTDDLREWCRSELVIPNPEYEKKVRMGLWTGSTPRSFALYERIGDGLVIPFGCLRELYGRYGSQYVFKSHIKHSEKVLYESHINPYDYQEKAIQEATERRNGILVMPCGAGKTNCGLEIISRLGVPTLWLTHTQDLLSQSMNRAKSVLGIAQSSYGTITGGKVNIGTGITFATVQTMSKIDLTPYRNVWGCVVVDECHKAVGTPTKVMQFYRVLSQISCRYKYGLTATPKRADGLEKTMFALLGEIICEVSRDAVADTTCPVEVVSIKTGYRPNLDIALCGDGTINYNGLVEDLTHNDARFQCVSDAVNGLDGASLVLGNRVEYLQKLNEAYNGRSVCLSAMGNSKEAKAERKEALRKLNCGEFDCVFASYKLAAEGLDCPNLKYVVLATPEKDSSLIQQATGRVGRKAPGKEYGTVIDFVDNFGMYKGWYKKRLSVYKKLGYAIYAKEEEK